MIKRFYIFGELWELIYWSVTFFQMKLEVVGFLLIATTNPTTSTKCRWILLRGAGTERSVAVGVWRLLLCREEGLFQDILIHITFTEIYAYDLMIYEFCRNNYTQIHEDCILTWMFMYIWVVRARSIRQCLNVWACRRIWHIGCNWTWGFVEVKDDVWNLVMEWLSRVWLQ